MRRKLAIAILIGLSLVASACTTSNSNTKATPSATVDLNAPRKQGR